jgi:hypothetical protein
MAPFFLAQRPFPSMMIAMCLGKLLRSKVSFILVAKKTTFLEVQKWDFFFNKSPYAAIN